MGSSASKPEGAVSAASARGGGPLTSTARRLLSLLLHSSVGIALAAVLVALLAQAVLVYHVYDGHWSALFMTGGRWEIPPDLRDENIYEFPGSTGYDGQFYHYIAHDPLRRRGFHGYVNSSGLRYQRILVPGLAYLLAGGQDSLIDTAYRAVILMFLFLGVYWTSRYAVAFGRHPAMGLTFLLLPTVIICLERMTIEIALSALTVAFALEARRDPSWRMYLILVAAALTRETGLFLTGGYLLHCLLGRKLVRAAIFSTSGLPWAVWSLIVRDASSDFAVRVLTRQTLHARRGWGYAGLIQRLTKPLRHRSLTGWKVWAARVTDYMGWIGMILLAILGIRMALRRSPGPVELAAALCGVAALTFGYYSHWFHPVNYTRWLAPLLVLVGLTAISDRSRLAAVAVLMINPRLVIELAPRALVALKSISSAIL